VSNLYNPSTKELLDQSVVTFFKQPKSFTGQDVVEISAHGGIIVAKNIISVLCFLGCRNAHEGEFSYRAFINGKIDLIQAEAIANIIDSGSDIDVLFSLENLSGKLSGKINIICEKLKNILTYMEHELDFNEGEVDFIAFDKYSKKIDLLIDESKEVVNCSFLPNQNKSDVMVSILGRPNVGKSSLFNALLGHDRSIVTDLSGTTRDVVDAHLTVSGLRVCLVDTAGIRKTKNKVEEEGVRRAEEKINESDLIILVDDKNPKKIKHDLKIENKSVFLVQNKVDVFKQIKGPGVFFVSCKTGKGLSSLYTHLSTYIKDYRRDFMGENQYVVSDRLLSLLDLFIDKLIKTKRLLKISSDLTIITSSLYDAYDVFVSSSSPSNKDDIINNIFKGFCVGK
jgi:tRNA modification GTPase